MPPRDCGLHVDARVKLAALLCFRVCPMYQCSITDAREQYTALVDVKNGTEWCRQGGAAEDYTLAAKAFETIDDDVNRTNVGDSEERERVRRVLKAFALKNPKTGYCQVTSRNRRPPIVVLSTLQLRVNSSVVLAGTRYPVRGKNTVLAVTRASLAQHRGTVGCKIGTRNNARKSANR